MGGKAHSGRRVPRFEALEIMTEFIGLCGEANIERWDVAGSVRRGLPEVGDIDLVMIPKIHPIVMTDDGPVENDEVLTAFLSGLWGFQKNGSAAKSGLFKGVQIDVNLTTEEMWGAQLQHSTGSVEHNVRLRRAAIRKGMKLSQKGLFDRKTDERIAGDTEEGVYEALGMEYPKPEDR